MIKKFLLVVSMFVLIVSVSSATPIMIGNTLTLLDNSYSGVTHMDRFHSVQELITIWNLGIIDPRPGGQFRSERSPRPRGNAPMSGYALVFQHLRKSYKGWRVLDIPWLGLHAGGCTLLSGPNGTGKSTLLRIIAGLEPPDSGPQPVIVRCDGGVQPWERCRLVLRREVVYVHQHPYLFDASVGSNVGYGLVAAGVPARTRRKVVAEALEWAGLAHLAGRHAHHLSGGERQRVAIIRARVLHPRLLLLDEPTANLDPGARQQTYELIRRLRREGIGVLVTSHELEALEGLADVRLHLERGRLYYGPDTSGAELADDLLPMDLSTTLAIP